METPGLNPLSMALTEQIERCRVKSDELQKSGVIIFPGDDAQKEAKPVSRLGVCGVDRKYRNCSFDNFQGGAKLVGILKHLAAEGKSVLLTGNTGCGKTHLAVSMMNEFIKHSQDALFVTLPELLLEIRSSFYGSSGTTEKALVDWYSTRQFLVLDDLGAEKPSEFTVATLYLILDRRIRQERQTVITTNLKTMEEIEQYAGSRIASRISEMELITVNMPDYRKMRRRGNHV